MELKAFRQEMGWTLEEAAAFIDLSSGKSWSRYETGERVPRPHIVDKIERLSGGRVTADDHKQARLRFERERDQQKTPA